MYVVVGLAQVCFKLLERWVVTILVYTLLFLLYIAAIVHQPIFMNPTRKRESAIHPS
jgi:hypothetical protein